METIYKDITIADLERIFSYTQSELSEKEAVYSAEPNEDRKTQIHGLREVKINIETELLLRRTSNSLG